MYLRIITSRHLASFVHRNFYEAIGQNYGTTYMGRALQAIGPACLPWAAALGMCISSNTDFLL